MAEPLRRRSGSLDSSVSVVASCHEASCRRTRAALWAWTSPVATQRSPRRRGERCERAVAGAVARRGTGAAARRAAARGPKASRSRRTPASSCTPCCAQPVRQTSPSAWAQTASSGDGGSRRVARGARGCGRERASAAGTGCASPAPRRDQQRQVATPSVEARARRRGSRAVRVRAAPCANSIEPQTAVVVGQRERP